MLLFLLLVAACGAEYTTDIDVTRAACGRPPTLQFFARNFTAPSTGRTAMAYVGIADCAATRFATVMANASAATTQSPCAGVANVSAAAAANGCVLAMNAGFFSIAGEVCLGNVVTSGRIRSAALVTPNGTQPPWASFGVTRSGELISGYLLQSDVDSGAYLQLAQGFVWLVRNGTQRIAESMAVEQASTAFVEEKAPRTVLGYTRGGRLLMVQVDGQEDVDAGFDLYELSELMLALGAWSAVNVDGGGSSTTVFHGRLVDRPTCMDNSTLCERRVNTVSCLLP